MPNKLHPNHLCPKTPAPELNGSVTPCIFIGGQSALELHISRRITLVPLSSLNLGRKPKRPHPAVLTSADAAVLRSWLVQAAGHPTHIEISVYAASPDDRTRHHGFKGCVWGTPLQARQAFWVPDAPTKLPVVVASPALALVHFAQHATNAQLIGAASELMGYHGIVSPYQKAPNPLCTKDQLLSELNLDAPNTAGLNRVAQAARLAWENTRSILEVECASLLCLPRHLGGLELPRPLLNSRLAVPQRLVRILGYDHIKADLRWEQQRVAIEVQGKGHTTGQSSRIATDDIRRINVLQFMGYQAIQVSTADLTDLVRFERLALRLGRLLHTTVQLPTGNDWLERGRTVAALRDWRMFRKHAA